MESLMIVGDGGREDAFARLALEQEDRYCLHVSEGMAAIAGLEKIRAYPRNLKYNDLVRYAIEAEIEIVYLGPDQPNVDGLADHFKVQGIGAIGALLESGRFEGSKIFGVEFNEIHQIPQPEFLTIYDQVDADMIIQDDIINLTDWVIKADGLAAGKGVILPKSRREAITAIYGMLSGESFGDAGKRLILQEKIKGPEVSINAVFGKDGFVILPPAQDHKRLLDNDKGPNTGGMGAYTGVPESELSTFQYKQIEKTVEKIYEAMKAEGINYRGPIFIGFMLDEKDGVPKVIEYNVRFGDPEAQVIFPSLPNNFDLIDNLIRAEKEKSLRIPIGYNPRKLDKVALTVCLSGEGYPERKYRGSRIINGANSEYYNVILNHGNTYIEEDGTVWSEGGGRMIYSTGVGNDIYKARTSAYIPLLSRAINSEKSYFRTDIGKRAVSL